MNTEQLRDKIADILQDAGWRDVGDAQWTRLLAALPEIKQALAAEPEQAVGPEKLELLPISEELLEQLFWEFDAARKQTDERFAFKGKLRWVDSKAKNQKPTPLVRLTTAEIKNLADVYGIYLSVRGWDNFVGAVMDAMIKKNGGV